MALGKKKIDIKIPEKEKNPVIVNSIHYVNNVQNNDNIIHTHNISEITNLTTELSNKADINHNHQISDVQNLQNELDGKANIIHTHTISDVNNLQLELNTKANISHIHQISDVQNLQTTLDGKANISHTHNISDINNLQTILNSKADLNQVVRVDVNNQSLSNVEKINFLNNLNAYKSITYLSNANIPLNGNDRLIGTFSIPHKGNFIILVRLEIQVIFMRNRNNRLQMQFQINGNEFNEIKYLNNFFEYYSYNINQTLSFECNYNFLHSFNNSDTLNLFLRTTLVNNILSVSLVEGEILVINY